MLKEFKKQLKSGFYNRGSSWSFDWYIDEIFTQQMSFGDFPYKLGYFQPVLGDEFLTPQNASAIIEENKDFFKSPSKVRDLIEKQTIIIRRSRDLLKNIKGQSPLNIDLDEYLLVQRQLSLLMASVSVLFDELIAQEIDRLSFLHHVDSYQLSSYLIDQSSVAKLQKSNQALLSLYENNPNLTSNDLKEHAANYGWLNTGERSKQPWDENDFYQQLQDLLKKDSSPSISTPHCHKELKPLIAINRHDNQAADIQIELDFYFQKYLKQELKENYVESIIENLTFEEIRALLKKPSFIDTFTPRKNNLNRVLFPYQGKVYSYYLSQKEFEELNSLIKGSVSPTSDPIVGSVACQGLVEGKVRLIKNNDDFQLFIPGEILVAAQTQPSYVQYMSQAKAIVTDVGGITSHAAIIAREFNIPCIVATKNATEKLKTGDTIKVDAFEGKVEKLS